MGGKNLPLAPRKEDKGSFSPQNLLVETQVLPCPPEHRTDESKEVGVFNRLDRVRRMYPKAALNFPLKEMGVKPWGRL